MSWARKLGGRLPDFADVVRRFPIAVLIMAVFTVWLIVQQLGDGIFGEDEEHIFGGFILCGYIAVIMGLISEARGWKRPKGLMLGISVGLPTFLVCYLAKHLDFNVPMAIVAAIVFLGNAAAFRKARHDSHVWNFTQKLWTGAIFAAVGCGVFSIGMVAISEAVESLFGVKIDNLTYDVLMPIGLAFLAPIYWMGTLPRYGDVKDVSELSFEARALSFLGTWMLAPLVAIYSLIILAYGAKVLIQWELPKGEIATLVTPFLGVGMLVWLMLEPKIMKESGFVRFYRRVWHWVMLPAAILLAIAVFVRIREYGFTTERFLLMLVSIWAFTQSLWFMVRAETKRDIRVPTGIAAVLLLFGAFVAEPISLENQFQRARLAKIQLSDFDADTIVQNPKAAKTFLGALDFMVRQEDQKRFNKLLSGVDMPGKYDYEQYEDLIEVLGFKNFHKRTKTRRKVYSVSSKMPIEFSSEMKFYGSFSFVFYGEENKKSPSDIVTSQNGLVLDITIENQTYPIDFGKVISEISLDYEGDSSIDIKLEPISVMSKEGVSGQVFILNGYFANHGDAFYDANFDIALVLPN